MSSSERIAGLVGPTLITLTVSETINLDIWKTNDAPNIKRRVAIPSTSAMPYSNTLTRGREERNANRDTF